MDCKTLMVTVSKGVFSPCKTWSFTVQKMTFRTPKGHLLQTRRKRVKTVSKNHLEITNRKPLP